MKLVRSFVEFELRSFIVLRLVGVRRRRLGVREKEDRRSVESLVRSSSSERGSVEPAWFVRRRQREWSERLELFAASFVSFWGCRGGTCRRDPREPTEPREVPFFFSFGFVCVCVVRPRPSSSNRVSCPCVA